MARLRSRTCDENTRPRNAAIDELNRAEREAHPQPDAGRVGARRRRASSRDGTTVDVGYALHGLLKVNAPERWARSPSRRSTSHRRGCTARRILAEPGESTRRRTTSTWRPGTGGGGRRPASATRPTCTSSTSPSRTTRATSRRARWMATSSTSSRWTRSARLLPHRDHHSDACSGDAAPGTTGWGAACRPPTAPRRSMADAGELDVVGQIADLAEGERLHQRALHRRQGFVVTFRQVDPLLHPRPSRSDQPAEDRRAEDPGLLHLHPPGGRDHLLTIGTTCPGCERPPRLAAAAPCSSRSST